MGSLAEIGMFFAGLGVFFCGIGVIMWGASLSKKTKT